MRQRIRKHQNPNIEECSFRGTPFVLTRNFGFRFKIRIVFSLGLLARRVFHHTLEEDREGSEYCRERWRRARSAERSPPRVRVWVLLGDGAGDNAQLLRLAEALGWPFEAKRIPTTGSIGARTCC